MDEGSWIIAILAVLGYNVIRREGISPETKAGWKRIFKFVGWCYVAAFVFAMCIAAARAQTTQHTFRDANGRSMGRSVTDTKGNTTFYNDRGQNTGRSSTQNGTTTIYNERGQQTGTIRSNR